MTYTSDDDFVCGEAFDHDLPEPEYVDGLAVMMCRNCGAEIFEDEPAESAAGDEGATS